MLTTIRLQPLRELISSPPYFFRNLFSPWALAFLLGAVFFRSLFSPWAPFFLKGTAFRPYANPHNGFGFSR
jgi:hypothetical protein